MKKILSIILAGLTLFLLGSCSKVERPVYDPANNVAPVLEGITVLTESTVLNNDMANETFAEFVITPASFGVKVSIKYTIYMGVQGADFAESEIVLTTTALPGEDGKIRATISVAEINEFALSLAPAATETTFEFKVSANMIGDDSSTNIVLDGDGVKTVTLTSYEPPKPEAAANAWGVCGTITDWGSDILMTEFYTGSGVWVSEPIKFKNTDDQYKFRQGAAWDVNYGGAADGVALKEDEAYTALTAGGSNFIVTEDQVERADLRLVLDVNEGRMVAYAMGWGIVGNFNNWGNADADGLIKPDYPLYKNETGALVAYNVPLTTGGTKFRYLASWSIEEYGFDDGVSYVEGEPLALKAGGGNAEVPQAGLYNVVLNLSAKTVTFTYVGEIPEQEQPEQPVDPELQENLWGVIGSFAASNWATDVYMKEFPAESGMWISSAIEFAEGDMYKIRYNNGWDDNRGLVEAGQSLYHNVNSSVTHNGNDIVITAEQAGKRVVVYNSNNETMSLLGWGLVGVVFGSNWDADVPMETDGNSGIYITYASINGGCKLRWEADWTSNRGLAEGVEFALNTPMSVVNNGGDFNVPEGSYMVIYDSINETVTFTSVE